VKKHNAFTMLELLFAIVVIGILSKFGVEFLAQAYRNFIYSNINHTLQAQSANAVELIASRLQYRIKDSVIARHEDDLDEFYPVADLNTTLDQSKYTVLEWIGEDVEGLRGNGAQPYWSGVFDLEGSSAAALTSIETNTTNITNLIGILSDGNSSINDAGLYFISADNEITGMGWQGKYYDKVNSVMFTYNGALADQNQNIHRITTTANLAQFAPSVGTFGGVDIYEYYKLAWTAYAVTMENYNATTKMGTLSLWYDYQPWMGEEYTDGKKVLLAENVSTFRFISLASLMKIQVCIKSDLLEGEEHSICKDKTVF
jgi:prepilin-type N-terminal cleavage/methylation domain-containing protein